MIAMSFGNVIRGMFGINKYDTVNLAIYYISDIHLDWLLMNKQSNEVQKLVSKKARELASSVHNKQGLVLIAGDTSSCVEHASLFYNSLLKLLPRMNIIEPKRLRFKRFVLPKID